MNKFTRLLALSILLVGLSVVLGSASGKETPTVFNDGPALSEPQPVRGAGVNQLSPMTPGVVLVGLKSDVTLTMQGARIQTANATLNSALDSLGVQSAEPVFPDVQRRVTATAMGGGADLSHIYRLRLAPNADISRAVQILSAHPAVAYAEPDYLAHVITTPNDPLYAGQWGLAQINAPVAWDIVTGTTDVVVAVIDAGLDTTHPDLAGQLWTNPGEIAGNGTDDDNNGYVDDIHGWNFVNDDADLSDNTGHGTQVAGVIAAATNNSQGVAGVCWNCRLMVVKVTQAGGVANYSDIAAGVAYAAQKGADVINLSLGGYSDSATLKAAVAAASETTVVVGGAGNDNKSDPFYPAAYDDYVLAVAGTTSADTKVGTSNYGAWVDVSAPGESITTTFSGGGYGSTSGTSMAAPFAAGLAGLLRGQHSDWSPAMVRAQIVHTTGEIDSLNPGHEGELGSGRVDAGQAVTTVAQPLLQYEGHTVDGEPDGRPEPDSTVDLNITLFNDWADATNVQATLSTADVYATVTAATASYGDIAAYQSETNATSFRFSVSSSAPYAHVMPFSLTITTMDGYSVALPLTITTQSGTVSVSGMISSDTTWTNDKTYLVIGNVLVSSGATLTIQPGTEVKFNPGTSLVIGGTLIADGTESQEIIFTSARPNPVPGDWEIVKFTASAVDAVVDSDGNCISGSIFKYARIEYGRGVGLVDALPYFSHVTFSENSGNNEGVVTGCVDSASALHWTGQTPRYGSLVVRDSEFIENQGQGFATNQPGGGSVYFDVANNQFLRNGGAAIVICNDFGGARIVSNIITDNGAGISLGNTGNGVVIEDNFVSGSTQPAYTAGFGLDIYSGSPVVRHNVFANNGQGQTWCNGRCSVINIFSGGAPTVISNTFTSNWLDSLIYFNYSGGGTYQYNNWAGNRVDYVFYRSTNSNQNVTATLDYWGTTDTTMIDGLIFDFLDDFNPGQVFYQPVLTTPEPSAPAFLWNTDVSPNPVGIQQVAFVLTLSASMDQSIDPVVTFGATEPYTSFVVADNAQWLSDRVWSATYDMTSLVPRGAYTISVSSARGATTMVSGTLALPLPGGGMEIPTDTRFGFTVDYAGEITDQTPPPPPGVIAGGVEGDASTVEAMWWASDPDSSITGYRYAIGSAAGATDIVNWTTTSSNSVSRSGLGLVDGQQYWLAVQARNEGGLWSASGYSAFVAGQPFHTVFLPLVLRSQ